MFSYTALVERVGRQVAVEVFGAQVGHHFRRRHHTDLNVFIRVQAMLGDVIAQQEVVHGVFERHAEAEALPVFRVALIAVLVVQHDGLPVDVLNGRHDERCGGGAGPHGHGQRHRREHVRGVVFAVQGFIPRHRPAGGFDQLNIQAVAGIKAHGVGHDDGGGAGDGHKADFEFALFQRAKAVFDRGFDFIQRNDAAQNGGQRPGAGEADKFAALQVVVTEQAAHNGAFHGAVEDVIAAVQILRPERWR